MDDETEGQAQGGEPRIKYLGRMLVNTSDWWTAKDGRWTLGENEGEPHFPAIDERPVGAGPYWWRKELRRRAALDGDA